MSGSLVVPEWCCPMGVAHWCDIFCFVGLVRAVLSIRWVTPGGNKIMLGLPE